MYIQIHAKPNELTQFLSNMSKATLKPETATQAFYREIAELKPRLPKDWKTRFFQKYPAYDSYRGGILLHHVINGNSTDSTVLTGIREIVKEFETENAAQ